MTPIWETLARGRHDNQTVLGAVKNGAGTRDQVATATGLTRARVVLALRRLEVLGLVEWTGGGGE